MIKTLFATPSQKVVRSRIRDLFERLNRSCNVEIDCNNDSVEKNVSQVLDTSKESSTSKKIKNYPLSLKEQLQREIEQSMNSPEKTSKAPSADLLSTLRKEMSVRKRWNSRAPFRTGL